MGAVLAGLQHLLGADYVRHALLAGSAVALLAGAAGYFVVLRAQVFVGDALSHVSYTGALAALAIGTDLRVGLFVATGLVAIGLSIAGRRVMSDHGVDDIAIGTVFAWVLGLGVFFLSLYTTRAATGDSTAGVTVLFGSIFGLSASAAAQAVWIALGATAVLAAIARPLLFASLDPAVAAARGVPVRLLGTVFLLIVAVAAAEASQAVGSLLLLGLVAAPAATARLCTARPWRALVLSAVIAIGSVWIGIMAAYAWPAVPASFAILAGATAAYLVAGAATGLYRRGRFRQRMSVLRNSSC